LAGGGVVVEWSGKHRETAMTKHTWVELDLAQLQANLAALRNVLKNNTKVIFVVKANAYGHGLVPVAQTAWAAGVRWFAVAHIDEVAALRRELPEANILVLGVLQADAAAAAAELRAIPVLVSHRQATALAGVLPAGATLECHVKVDTGMGRLGFAWQTAANELAEILKHHPALRLTGLCTHFASANPVARFHGDGTQVEIFADTQLDRFRHVLTGLTHRDIHIPFHHVSNSGGVLCDAAWELEGVRVGILLYGYGRPVPAEEEGTPHPQGRHVPTRPFLQWRTRVIQVKQVPAGFPVSYDSTYITGAPT